MSIATVVMGLSGSGKSTSLRNLDPVKTIIIQAIKKPLPFRSADWKNWDNDTKSGSIAVTDNARHICAAIQKAESNGKLVVIIDDFQYVMANEFMRRSGERGFDKFTEIAKGAWDVFNAAMNAPDNTRVYIMTHVQTDDYGQGGKLKTIGKMLDEKIVLEGMVSIVLRSMRSDGAYSFRTQSDGTDTVKSPIDLFDTELIDNDLNIVDEKICEYYGLTK